LSHPRTPLFRGIYRKPARRTLAVAGTTAAAANVIAANIGPGVVISASLGQGPMFSFEGTSTASGNLIVVSPATVITILLQTPR